MTQSTTQNGHESPFLAHAAPAAHAGAGLRIEPSSGAAGADVYGVDVAALSDAEFATIYAAWLEHHVLFFRDQALTPAGQTAFAARFGELDTYPFMEPIPGHPHVIPIIKEKTTRYNFGGGWHTDMSYVEHPPKATFLYAVEVPTRGGDTLFASMEAAYASLSSGMQQMLEGMRAVFSAAKVHGASGVYQRADHPMEMRKNETQEQARFVHPVVRTHPETGRKSLFLDGPHVERFENMRVSESEPLIQFLCQHATQPQFTTRLRWTPGTLAVWDNRCLQHYALNDYQGQRREMNRVVVKGDAPR
jgi:taurine dioxygenase